MRTSTKSLRTATHIAIIGVGLLASVVWTGFLGYGLFTLLGLFI